jgi:hypothetical protein
MATAIVHFSDILVRVRGAGYAGDSLAPAVHPAALELLALKAADIRDALAKPESSLDESDGPLFES